MERQLRDRLWTFLNVSMKNRVWGATNSGEYNMTSLELCFVKINELEARRSVGD